MATSKSFSETVNKGSDAISENTDYTCDEHKGKNYEMYCKEHDNIYCVVCILKHRNCEGVEYLPEVAKMLLQQQNKDDLRSDLVNLSTELQYIKVRLSNYLKEMNTEESNIVYSINEFKKKMLKRIEEEAESSIAKVKSRNKAINDDIESDLKKVDQMNEDIKKHLSKLCRDSYPDDAEHFVTIKLAESKSTSGNEFASEMIWKPFEANVFECNSIFEQLLDEGSLGYLSVVERPLGEVVNILVGLNTDMMMNSTISSLQADLLNVEIRSKIIKLQSFDANVLTVCVVSNSWALNNMLGDLKKIDKLQNSKILLLCLTKVQPYPGPTFMGKIIGAYNAVTYYNYSKGYADDKCKKVKIPYVYIDTEDVNRSQQDVADAVLYILRTVRKIDLAK